MSEYSVSMRLFGVVSMVVSMVLMPFWPAYGEAVARGDVRWVKRMLYKTAGVSTAIAFALSVVLVLLGGWLVVLWTGAKVSPSVALLCGIGVWTVLSTAGNAVSVFLNGINEIGFQAVLAAVMAAVALVAKVLLAGAVGLPGVIWGTVGAYVVCVLIPLAYLLPRLLARMDEREWRFRAAHRPLARR